MNNAGGSSNINVGGTDNSGENAVMNIGLLLQNLDFNNEGGSRDITTGTLAQSGANSVTNVGQSAMNNAGGSSNINVGGTDNSGENAVMNIGLQNLNNVAVVPMAFSGTGDANNDIQMHLQNLAIVTTPVSAAYGGDSSNVV